jgi:hypothetical protein
MVTNKVDWSCDDSYKQYSHWEFEWLSSKKQRIWYLEKCCGVTIYYNNYYALVVSTCISIIVYGWILIEACYVIISHVRSAY